MSLVRIAAIIPARMNSRRFPGKPLVPVQGLPMIEHVRRRAQMCRGFSEVWVATCDRQVAEAVEADGGQVVMTSPEHPAATDRVAEAATGLNCTHVVNIQGDEILVLPSDLDRMVAAIRKNPDGPAWNATAGLGSGDQLADPSVVKCVLSRGGRILFCSRDFSRLPLESKNGWEPVGQILGILGYRKDFLARYPSLPRTPLECAESIDQSRILEHDLPLYAVPFSFGYPGINAPGDLQAVLRYLEQEGLQQNILQEML